MPELAAYLPDPELGKCVADALFRLGRIHRSSLFALAGDRAPLPVRQGVISIIGRFSDQQSMQMLVDLVKNDPVAAVRTAASHALILRGGHEG